MTNVIDLVAERRAAVKARADAATSLSAYIQFTRPDYKPSHFSREVCRAIDQFLIDVDAGKRPILILQAPPQHGKSQIVSRQLPAYILGRWPHRRIGCASYADGLAGAMAQDVRRVMASPEHCRLFAPPSKRGRYDVNRMGEFSAPGGTGSYIGVGVGAGLTGRPVDIGIIDDPIRDHQQALSQTVKESLWSWYQTVFSTRLSERSGQIIMATSWAEDDLSGRLIAQYEGNPRLTLLRFPAINSPDDSGYNHELPLGALVPQLKPLAQLLEMKAGMSDYWWSALYQQSPKAIGGNVFKESGIRYYLPKDLPDKFEKVVASLDATFKDTDGTDFVVFQVWGKVGANSYLLDQSRDRMSFTKTLSELVRIKNAHPSIRQFYIEDKANGPAVIDCLKGVVSGLIPVEPDGSKLARAHAVTYLWEAGNVFIPHKDVCPWIKGFVSEVVSFPVAANDDQVDAMTQALRQLYPLRGAIKISKDALARAMAPR